MMDIGASRHDARGGALPPVGDAYVAEVSRRMRDELQLQLDAAIGFADYCSFLTAGGCAARSAELVAAAEALMADVSEAIARTAPAKETAAT